MKRSDSDFVWVKNDTDTARRFCFAQRERRKRKDMGNRVDKQTNRESAEKQKDENRKRRDKNQR